jgi:hypothetical protein
MKPQYTDTHTLLKETKALIQDPKHWCSIGWGSAGPKHDNGTRCLMHAMDTTLERRMLGGVYIHSPGFESMRVALLPFIGLSGLSGFNDTNTHDIIMAALDKAIEATKPEVTE